MDKTCKEKHNLRREETHDDTGALGEWNQIEGNGRIVLIGGNEQMTASIL